MIASDDFSGNAIGSIWSLEGPDAGASAGLASAGGEAWLELVVPAGNHDLWGSQNKAVRLMQDAADTDFTTEVAFLSTPTQNIQSQGLLIEEDADTWIRFDTYSNKGKLYVFGAATVDGASSTKFNFTVAVDAASHLKVIRDGDLWTFQYSGDGEAWTTAGSFTQALTVTAVGPFAGGGSGSPAHTTRVDYFENAADPILNEDGLETPQPTDDLLASDGSPLVIDITNDLLANDTDPNGDPLNLAGFGQPAHGTLTDNGNGTLTYTPNAGFFGSDSFTYTVSDGENTAAATVTVDVADPGNAAPNAVGDTVTAVEDTPIVINVLANDSDPDGDPLSLAGFTQPSHGTVVANGDGTLTYTPGANYNGTDGFSYTVSDGNGHTTTATVGVTVGAVNDAPTAAADSLTAVSGTSLTIVIANLLANDSDPDGDTLSFAGFTQPAHGTLVNNGDGTLTYTPNPGFSGADSFNYTVGDGQSTSQAAVSLDVSVPASAAFQSDDFSGNAIGSIWSLEGPDAGASAGLASAGGEAWLELVVPAGNHDLWGSQNKAVRLMQDAADTDFTTEVAFLSTPTQNIQSQGLLIEEDADTWIRFDTYSNKGKLYVFGAATVDGASSTKFNFTVAVDAASHLKVIRDGDLWTFQYSGDGEAWTTAGSFTQALTVTAVGPFAGGGSGSPAHTTRVDYFENAADPILNEDGLETPQPTDDLLASDGSPLVIDITNDLLANDTDPNGDPLNLAGFGQPAHGTLTDNGNGTLTYTPNAGFFGSDSFTYTVSDGENTAAATVTVDVADPGNAAPNAVGDTVTAVEDTPIVINVLANDSDPDGDPLSLAGFTQPSHGTVVANGDGTLTYTPGANYNGTDGFSYTVSDGNGHTTTATVGVTVGAVNDAPTAAADSLTAVSGTSLTIVIANLLANDSDPDGDTLSFAGFTQPAHGTLVNNGDGTLTYTPNPGFSGADSFNYTVGDGQSTSQAAVSLDVSVPASAAFQSDDFSGNAIGSIWSLEGPDAGASAGLASAGGEAWLELVVPAGNHDLWGSQNKAVRLMQDAADTDFTTEVAFLSTPTQNIQSQGLLIEEDADTWIRFDTYSNKGKLYVFGAATVDGASSTKFNFTVAVDAASHLKVIRDGDLWTFQYSGDGEAWTTAGSFTQALTVTAVGPFAGGGSGSPAHTTRVDYFENAADPILNEDGLETPQPTDDLLASDGSPLVIDITNDLLANDTDPNGDPLNLAGFGQPAHGTLTDNGNGTLTYTPNAGFFGSDSFTYTVSDGENTAAATVTVDVADPGNAAPNAVGDTVTAVEDTPIVINVLANDSDPDGDPLSLAGFTQPSHGTVVANGDGTLTYTPGANYNGTDGFSYTVSDGNGHTTTATVGVTVGAVNDAPTAAADSLTAVSGTSLTIVIANLLANDSDPDGDTLSFAGFTQPAHGTLVNNGDGTLTYTPNPGFSGADSFNYTVGDGQSTSQAAVSLNVSDFANIVSDDFNVDSLSEMWSLEGPAAGVNLASDSNDAYVELTVPAGNYDAWDINNTSRLMQSAADENFGLEARFLSTPTARYQMQGILVEQDSGNWIRFDTYSDGTKQYVFAGVTVAGDSVARLKVTVAAGSANYLRVTRVDDVWTLQHSTDGEHWTTAGSFTQSLNVSAVGLFAGSTGGAPGFTAKADYFFNTANPLVPEDNLPVPPHAVDDVLTTAAATALTFAASDLLANDTDTNGDTLNLAGFGQPAHGTLTDNGNGTLTYTPNAGFTGVDSFTYTVGDGVFTDNAEVRVGVGNSAPLGQDDVAVTAEDTAVILNVLANDGDPDDDTITITGLSNPAHGSVLLNPDGTLSYTPNANFNGIDSFTYTVSDGVLTDTVNVSLTVNSVPDAPYATDDELSTTPRTPLIISIAGDLLANDGDADGDPLTFAGFTQTANGTLVNNGNGTLTYTPFSEFSGVDSFTYTINDGTGRESTANVEIGVSAYIDVWYGSQQTFGEPGMAQKWVNIHGNADPDDVVSLTYSLNGGQDRWLELGPDTRRLQNPGDFNIDIDRAALDGSSVDDVVRIKATLTSGEVVTRDVVIDYEDGNRWNPNYSIDWSTVTNIQDVAQVIDGKWSVSDEGARLTEPGYDRFIAIGDQNWDNYELNVSVTTHDLTSVDPRGRDGGVFGFGMLWNGHTDDPISGWQPKSGWNPCELIVYKNTDSGGRFYFFGKSGTYSTTIDEDATYNFSLRVEQNDALDHTYKLKFWEAGSPEPTNWLIQRTVHYDTPQTGSLFLLSHYYDVTFGDLTVEELPGNDIVVATNEGGLLSAVDSFIAAPGQGEKDVLRGGSGADTFLIGEDGLAFYDDGNATSAGLNDYGLIWDFQKGTDEIQLAGTAADYELGTAPSGLQTGTAVYKIVPGETDELIAVVANVTGLSLDHDFVYDPFIA